MRILIFDRNPEVVAAFSGFDDVIIAPSDIETLEVEAVVSPANSFGFMDGGIDYAYSSLFGPRLQQTLQAKIAALPFGELLVGQALMLETGHLSIPKLISAPTMRVPSRIYDLNDIMLACRAAVKIGLDRGIASVAFPGMGTGCGEVPASSAARAMICGMRNALHPMAAPKTWKEAQYQHFNLISEVR